MTPVEVFLGGVVLAGCSFYMGARYGVQRTFQWLLSQQQIQKKKDS